jgi:hypothetical protein
MAIIDIVGSDEVTSVALGTTTPVEVINVVSEVVEVNNTDNQTNVAVEVLKGLPGVQNLYVGYSPPDNPQEGWVWIDLNG